jgi:D-beta-D-heptose 7-phosphate kinase/D-beta-D-heptose 1-phosphate adenosyltransferase
MNPLLQHLSGLAPGTLNVMVVGDVLLDRYLTGRCERISPEAPVQVLDVTSVRRSLGGAGNVVANLRALGAKVGLASAVGDDATGREIEELVAELGIARSLLRAETGRRTPEKTRLMAVHQQVIRFDSESRHAIDAGTEQDLLRFLRDAPAPHVLVLSDYAKGVLTPALCEGAIAWARAAGIPVIVDPKGTDYRKYAGATLITPNRKEAGEATGIAITDRASLLRAGAALRERFGIDHCVVTLSEEGMGLFSPDGFHHLSAEAREVYDVTGAGDTVVATLALAVAAKLPMLVACQLANVAAGIKVGKLGTATVSMRELRDATQPTMAAKVVSVEELLAELAIRRQRGARVVFTNGCFDLLHRGHVDYLERAAARGDVLVLGLNTDASVRRLKGEGRPINHQEDRALVLAALASVDHVVLFDDDTPLELIKRVQPDVLVKGGDYTADTIVGADVVRARGGEVVVLPFVPGRSTTTMLKALGERKPS